MLSRQRQILTAIFHIIDNSTLANRTYPGR
jgi:hypothetical protein